MPNRVPRLRPTTSLRRSAFYTVEITKMLSYMGKAAKPTIFQGRWLEEYANISKNILHVELISANVPFVSYQK